MLVRKCAKDAKRKISAIAIQVGMFSSTETRISSNDRFHLASGSDSNEDPSADDVNQRQSKKSETQSMSDDTSRALIDPHSLYSLTDFLLTGNTALTNSRRSSSLDELLAEYGDQSQLDRKKIFVRNRCIKRNDLPFVSFSRVRCARTKTPLFQSMKQTNIVKT